MPTPNKSIMESVLGVFLQNRNQTVTLDQICKELGEEPRRVQSNIANLRNSPGKPFEIQVVLRGRAWMYRDKPVGTLPSIVPFPVDNAVDSSISKVIAMPVKLEKAPISKDKIFEEVGQLNDGSVLLKDVDGKFWQATAL